MLTSNSSENKSFWPEPPSGEGAVFRDTTRKQGQWVRNPPVRYYLEKVLRDMWGISRNQGPETYVLPSELKEHEFFWHRPSAERSFRKKSQNLKRSFRNFPRNLLRNLPRNSLRNYLTFPARSKSPPPNFNSFFPSEVSNFKSNSKSNFTKDFTNTLLPCLI